MVKAEISGNLLAFVILERGTVKWRTLKGWQMPYFSIYRLVSSAGTIAGVGYFFAFVNGSNFMHK